MKQPTIVVYVEGGVIQGSRANTENICLEVFDVDDLMAEGKMTRNEIEELWESTWVKDCPHPIS